MRFACMVAAALAVTMAGCAADAQPVRTHVVAIRQFLYSPDTLMVSVGDTIRWVNEDFVPHTATAADSSWTSGRLESGGEWVMVVEQGSAGDYVCAYHPNMAGVLRIR